MDHERRKVGQVQSRKMRKRCPAPAGKLSSWFDPTFQQAQKMSSEEWLIRLELRLVFPVKARSSYPIVPLHHQKSTTGYVSSTFLQSLITYCAYAMSLSSRRGIIS